MRSNGIRSEKERCVANIATPEKTQLVEIPPLSQEQNHKHVRFGFRHVAVHNDFEKILQDFLLGQFPLLLAQQKAVGKQDDMDVQRHFSPETPHRLSQIALGTRQVAETAVSPDPVAPAAPQSRPDDLLRKQRRSHLLKHQFLTFDPQDRFKIMRKRPNVDTLPKQVSYSKNVKLAGSVWRAHRFVVFRAHSNRTNLRTGKPSQCSLFNLSSMGAYRFIFERQCHEFILTDGP
jgi:hypothetical protein